MKKIGLNETILFKTILFEVLKICIYNCRVRMSGLSTLVSFRLKTHTFLSVFTDRPHLNNKKWRCLSMKTEISENVFQSGDFWKSRSILLDYVHTVSFWSVFICNYAFQKWYLITVSAIENVLNCVVLRFCYRVKREKPWNTKNSKWRILWYSFDSLGIWSFSWQPRFWTLYE